MAKRIQLPLKVSDAITIHKSQEMSLNNVVVNCRNCVQAGQIGVAVGRAVLLMALKLRTLKKQFYRNHPILVRNFYETIPIRNIKDDTSCCKNIKNNISLFDQDDDDDHYDDNRS